MPHSSLMTTLMLVVVASVVGLSAYGDAKYIRATQHVPNSYIVQFASGHRGDAEKAMVNVGGAIGERFTMIDAVAVTLTDAQAQALTRKPFVQVVEENAEIDTASTSESGLNVRLRSTLNPATLWGLDRTDQLTLSNLRVDNSYTWCANGTGVRAYVVDTGVRPTYGDISGRVDSAVALKTILASYSTSNPIYLNPQDCWNDLLNYDKAAASHGTGVATIIGGTQLGIAKGVTLVDARASSCTGISNSARLIRVLQWICQEDANRAGHPSVINISSSTVTRDPNAGALNA